MRIIGSWLLCHLIALAVAPAIWAGISAGYPGDSFWTLSMPGRIGVITISLCGMMGIALIIGWKTQAILARTRHRWRIPVWLLDVGLGLLIFALIFSISPQIFYSFYRQIIPGLPAQWVIDGPLNYDRLSEVFIPRYGGSLADHLAALAIGGIVLFTAVLHRR